MLNITRSANKSGLKIKNDTIKVVRFCVGGGVEIAKKSEKSKGQNSSKFQKLSKSEKSKSEKFVKSKKLSKSRNLPNFGTIGAGSSFVF